MGAYLTRFGSMFGTVPAFTGRVFFVAPGATYAIDGRSYSASDNNDGLAPERALLTVTRAVTLTNDVTTRTNDTILLLEGTHTVTATVTPKAGTRLYGSHGIYGCIGFKPRTTLTIRGTSDELFDLAAGDIEIAYLSLQGTNDYSMVSFQTTSAISGICIHDCYFDQSTNGTYTINHRALDFGNRAGGQGISRIAAAAATAMATAYIENCLFETQGAAGEAVHIATADVKLVNCQFQTTAGTWATPVLFATNGRGRLERCVWFSAGGAFTLAVGGYHLGYAADVTGGFTALDCRVSPAIATAASAFLGFGNAASSMLAENYAAGYGGSVAAGGVLITRVN